MAVWFYFLQFCILFDPIKDKFTPRQTKIEVEKVMSMEIDKKEEMMNWNKKQNESWM